MTTAMRRVAALEAAATRRAPDPDGKDEVLESLAGAIQRIDEALHAERGDRWWLKGPPHYVFYRYCDINTAPPEQQATEWARFDVELGDLGRECLAEVFHRLGWPRFVSRQSPSRVLPKRRH